MSTAAPGPVTAPMARVAPPTPTSDTAALPAPKQPVSPGTITAVGVVLALLVVALGVVGLHDALVAADAVDGSSWSAAAVSAVDGTRRGLWLVPAGVLAVLVGLWLLLTALRPRPRTAIALRADTGVVLRPRDVAALARSTAGDVDGVTSATASAQRRRVSVAVVATSDDGVREAVAAAVAARFAALSTTPSIRVSVKTEGA